MPNNDDALAATALALNEDAKAARKRKPKAEVAPEPQIVPTAIELAPFALSLGDSDLVREAIDSDDSGMTVGRVDALWKDIGATMGFDPATLELVDMTDDGPIIVKAAPLNPASAELMVTGDDDESWEGVDAEEANNRGLQLMEQAAHSMGLASSTLVGDLTSGLLEVVKNIQKPWSAHSQIEKRDLVAKIQHIAKIVANQAVDIVAADDRITVKAICEKIAIADKVMITLKLASMPEEDQAEAIQQLFHCQKKTVLIVTADSDRHMGQRREIVEPDEEELPFDAGRDAPRAAPDHPDDDSDLAGEAEAGEDDGDESGEEPES